MIKDFGYFSFDISSVFMVGPLNLHIKKHPTYTIFFDNGKELLVYDEDPFNENIFEPIMNRDKFIKLWKKHRPKKLRLI